LAEQSVPLDEIAIGVPTNWKWERSWNSTYVWIIRARRIAFRSERARSELVPCGRA